MRCGSFGSAEYIVYETQSCITNTWNKWNYLLRYEYSLTHILWQVFISIGIFYVLLLSCFALQIGHGRTLKLHKLEARDSYLGLPICTLKYEERGPQIYLLLLVTNLTCGNKLRTSIDRTLQFQGNMKIFLKKSKDLRIGSINLLLIFSRCRLEVANFQNFLPTVCRFCRCLGHRLMIQHDK